MKRLAWMLILGLLAPVSGALAYDGPGTPLSYDQTINAIRVEFTSQPKILPAGRARFTMTAHVPIEADTLGKNIHLEIRRYKASGFDVVYSCDVSVSAIPAGGVAPLTCFSDDPTIFAAVFTPTGATSVGLYPFVFRPASSPVSELTHDGREVRLNVEVVYDDTYEPNNSELAASNLGTPTNPVTLTNLAFFDFDYYKFTTPPGAGAAEVQIDFWNSATDLDLWVLDEVGIPIAVSLTSTDDVERVGFPVGPGQVYYIVIVPGSNEEPAFYNLSFRATPPDIVTITQLPQGVPNPVGSQGLVQLSVVAEDSLGHNLTYEWTQRCLSTPLGVFSDRTVASPTWTAPQNTTLSAKTCTITVNVYDVNGVRATASFAQTIGPAGDSVTITSPPTSSANPVTSPNATNLSVTATDTLGHVLSYTWTATCLTLTGSGTFSPSANVQSPSWTPPSNQLGSQQSCTIGVTVSDNQGQQATAAFSQGVNPSPHTLEITAGPSGTPATVASSGVVAASVTAVDSYGHSLTYLWSSSCSGGLANGNFANGSTATPSWTAPANLTGLEQTCQISVVVNDGQGKTANGNYQQKVSPLPHTVTITTTPAGSPNPVVSGKVATLSVIAVDSYNHAVGYSWSASCPTLGSAGTFANPNVQNPTWTAPTNLTGVPHACTMTVTASDGQGRDATAQYTQSVATAPHEITFTDGPRGAVDPVASAGVVGLTATAQDSFLHPVTYSWSATCPSELGGNGTFSPGPTGPNPSWTAPANLTGLTQSCTINAVASDGQGTTAAKSYQQGVASAPHNLTIVTAPSGLPNPVTSGGAAALTVLAADSLNHAISYLWSASCPTLGATGTFAPDATSRTPTWTAPANLTGSTQACTLAVVATDTIGTTAAASFQQQVESVAHSLTITQAPSGTPNPTGSASTASLTVTAVDSLNHQLAYLWQAECPGIPGAHGTFSPSAAVRNPIWTAPANLTGEEQTCTLTVTVSDGQGEVRSGSYEHDVVSVSHSLTLTTPPAGTPNPVNSGGAVVLAVAAVDSLNHSLSYAWTALCSGGLGNGGFAPSAGAPAPTWTAPANTTGVPQTCTIEVVISDGQGESVSGSFSEGVNATAHTFTLTVPPTGTPNPVPSGEVVSLTTAVVDSYNHPVSYAWTATCPGLGSSGTFSPSAAVAAPAWQAPRNLTGVGETCTIEMSANDGQGESVSQSFAQVVSPAVHTLKITSALKGTPNPSNSGVPVSLALTVVDSFDHPLSYVWQGSCSAGGGGTFSPNTTSPAPTWTPPPTNGADLTCVLQALVFDSQGLSVSASLVQVVKSTPAPHTITFTTPPGGVPNPVTSAGAAQLTTAAADSLSHALSYQWSATCPGLSGSGSFTPGATVQNPVWTAPVNGSGTTQPCTIEVVASDGLGTSQVASFTQNVTSVTHSVTITAGPSGTPNPSVAGAAVLVQVTAVDSLAHALSYAWQASCPGALGGGTFAPSAAALSPLWTPPVHPNGEAFSCTISVDVTDGQGGAATGLFTQAILAGAPPAHTVSITTPPTGSPNPVAASGQVALTAAAQDSLNHPLGYTWSSVCPGLGGNGTFAPSINAQNPTWTAPANPTGTVEACTITVVASDGLGETATAFYVQSVNAATHSLTLAGPPAGTPNPSSPGAPVALRVTPVDTFGHALTHVWSASCDNGRPGTFSPNNLASSPTWTPPASSGDVLTCMISVLVFDSAGLSVQGQYVHSVKAGAPAHTVTFTTPPSGSPNPAAAGGAASLTTAATDSLGHTLAFQWTAVCPALSGPGSFTPSASVQNPTWTAPANGTGATQACTLTVVADDGQGESATASYTHNVSGTAHTVTITAGPNGAPNPSTPGQSVVLGVTAVDSLSHPLQYSWQATCPGVAGTGTFSPGAAVQAPTWTPPINTTGAAFSCTIRVDVSDGAGGSATGQYTHNVSAGQPTHTVTILAGPTGSPNPVSSSGSAAVSVTAIDSLGHSLTYAWTASCPALPSNGSFSPSASAASPTWAAPTNTTGATQGCTMSVLVNDGQGKTATGSYTQQVNSTAVTHTLTVTTAPYGVPNPSADGAPVALSVAAVDSLGHQLTYIWTASCTGASGGGTFAPSFMAQAPTWKPPTKPSAADMDCVVQVNISDGAGKAVTTFFSHRVSGSLTPPHSLTITTSPVGAPNPVASGRTAALSVAASDSLGHSLTYAWTATCPGLGDAGAFTPSAAVQNPAWTAPANLTGSEQTCTLAVAVEDGHGESVSASYAQRVSSVVHTLTIVSGPAGVPNPAAEGGAAQLSVTAADSLEHPLTYLWSASCPGGSNGSFSPNSTAPAPTWTAPALATPFSCVISVLVGDGTGKTTQKSYLQGVGTTAPPPHTVSFSVPPAGTPNPVSSGAAASLSATATDSLNHSLTYAWTAACPTLPNNGSFVPAATGQTPTWVAPANTTATPQSCTVEVVANDGQGQTATASYVHTVNPVPGTHTLNITVPPAGTPNPVASGGAVALATTAVDSAGHEITYAWQSSCQFIGGGTFSNIVSPAPIWTAPTNSTGQDVPCVISVEASDQFGLKKSALYIQTVQPAPHTLTIVVPPGGSPNPVDSSAYTQLDFRAVDSWLHTLTYEWTATCPGLTGVGEFSPSAAAATPTWQAPVNYTGVQKSCTLRVVVSDGVDKTETSSFSQLVEPGLVPITVVVTNWLGESLEGPSGTGGTLTARPNYAAVIYRADGTTEVHAQDVFSMNSLVEWPLEAQFAVGESAVLKVWRTETAGFSPYWDGSTLPAWRDNAAKKQLGSQAITIQENGTYTLKVMVDMDNDGMDDFWESRHGLSQTDPGDATQDPDVDTLTNLREFQLGTHPFKADTDGDGVNDNLEVANGDNPTDPTDWLPPALRATVGDKAVYLSWNGVLKASSVAVTVSRELGGGGVEDLGSISLADPKVDRVRVVLLPGVPGGPLTNGTAYRFGLTLVRGAVTRPAAQSELVVAVPGVFASAIEPRFPTLFLHGFGGRGDAQGSFADSLHFASSTLGWAFGGRFCFPGTGLSPKVDLDFAGTTQRAASLPGLGPAGRAVCDAITTTAPSALGEFFTVDFGDNFAEYGAVDTSGGGLFHQAAEVAAVFDKLVLAGVAVPDSPTKRVAIVGQGTGGLAATRYLADSQNPDDIVSDLVTHGSPHLGADTGYWCSAATNPAVGALGGVFGRLLASLTGSGACADPTAVGGVRDTLFSCEDASVVLNPFLGSYSSLPESVEYTSVLGFWQASSWNAGVLPDGGRRAGDCLGVDWDGYAPALSSDLGNADLLDKSVRKLQADRFTVTEGDDIASIYCGLEPSCLIVRLQSADLGTAESPVEMTVTGPDGRVASRKRMGIPGAGYFAPNVGGKVIETLVLPFIPSGTNSYTVTLTPKSGASAAARYRLEAVRFLDTTLGTELITAGTRVDAIPVAGHSFNAEGR